VRSREARNLFTRLAEISVHGANVQEGQIVLVEAEIGLVLRSVPEARAHRERQPGHARIRSPVVR
jgi:hypothetical protein